MADLGAINENVQFNWNAASQLIAELRSTANTLNGQVGQRRHDGTLARKQWEGVYAQQFDTRLGTCTSDAGRLAASMLRAARDLEALANLARQEQQRREHARSWVAQNDRNWLERNIVDPIFGEDVPPPPPPIEPPPIPIYDTPPGARGSAAPAAGR